MQLIRSFTDCIDWCIC